jgi:hypothetical protein
VYTRGTDSGRQLHQKGLKTVDANIITALAALAYSLNPSMCRLIEALHSGTGVWYLPTLIRRKGAAEAEVTVLEAKAKAEAAVIQASAEAQVRDIDARWAARLASRERRRQRNIEKIMDKAAETIQGQHSQEEAKPVDPDWATEFFESCQDVSNEEMQKIWTKLLAGEVTRPGSFSLKTLSVVKVLRKEDAEMFTRLCSYVWSFPDEKRPVIYQDEAGLEFNQFSHMESLGLIQYGASSGGYAILYKKPGPLPPLPLDYYGKMHLLKLPQAKNQLETGQVMFTAVGKELFAVAGAERNEEYRLWTVNRWRQMEIEVTELDTEQPSAVSPQ